MQERHLIPRLKKEALRLPILLYFLVNFPYKEPFRTNLPSIYCDQVFLKFTDTKAPSGQTNFQEVIFNG